MANGLMNEEQRAQLLQMAKTWERLAQEREAKIRTSSSDDASNQDR